jgi:3-hydroxyisobutyrate dehydrogenase-like beta-hydroxyacid dehydrogenase
MKVGLLSPGDMGQAVGETLACNGATVVTALEGRSERTRALATDAGFEDLGTLDAVTEAADIVLSIVVPAAAPSLAVSLAMSLSEGDRTVVVDCNAVAPATVRTMAEAFRERRLSFVDASIVGPPPRGGATPRIYASGPQAGDVAELGRYGLDVRVLDAPIGGASALKMSYAAITKGTTALATQLLISAWRNGVHGPLLEEFAGSLPDLLRFMEVRLPLMPMKSRRWVAEMEEISAAFEEAGIPGGSFLGIADLYRFVGENVLADETPESRDRDRDLEAVVRALAAQAEQRGPSQP